MDDIVVFKSQVTTIFSIMAKDSQGALNNLMIAQLNDLAYRAIRKTGFNKKLDERTIKNKGFF